MFYSTHGVDVATHQWEAFREDERVVLIPPGTPTNSTFGEEEIDGGDGEETTVK